MEIIEAIGDSFKIDNFLLSDILNTSRRTVKSFQVLYFQHKVVIAYRASLYISVEQISFLINVSLDFFQEKKKISLRI
jgi:magnesium transporter